MTLEDAKKDLFPYFSEISIIGKGMTANVYSALHVQTKRTVAIKQMHRSSMLNQRVRLAFESELKILEAADHPFIALFYNLIESELYFYIIIEIANRGTLSSYISTHGSLSELESVRIFTQILSALNYMHKVLNIIHRDVKIENILFDDFFNVRLIDFGLSKITDPDVPMTQTTCGTYPFTAPEILKRERYDKAVDFWSLGVCLYVMNVGELPFKSSNQKILIDQILNEEPNYPSNLSDDLIDLIKKLLNKNPAKRITAEQIEKHPWITNSKYSFYLTEYFRCDPSYHVTFLNNENDNIIDEKIANNMVRNNLDPKKWMELGSFDAMFYRISRKWQILTNLRGGVNNAINNKGITIDEYYQNSNLIMDTSCNNNFNNFFQAFDTNLTESSNGIHCFSNQLNKTTKNNKKRKGICKFLSSSVSTATSSNQSFNFHFIDSFMNCDRNDRTNRQSKRINFSSSMDLKNAQIRCLNYSNNRNYNDDNDYNNDNNDNTNNNQCNNKDNNESIGYNDNKIEGNPKSSLIAPTEIAHRTMSSDIKLHINPAVKLRKVFGVCMSANLNLNQQRINLEQKGEGEVRTTRARIVRPKLVNYISHPMNS